jgi:hypothetical protein
MSNAEELLAYTQKLFRELRGAWFAEVLRDRAHHGESAAHEQLREQKNKELRAKYDAQTERLLCGEPLRVAPDYEADLDT